MIDSLQRDLSWLIASPSLIDPTAVPSGFLAESTSLFQSCRAPLHQAIDQHLTLREWIESRRRKRLGHYAEDLLIWWFGQQSTIQHFHHSIPIREQSPRGGQRTLGELDFVWLDEAAGHIEHWELAVKFYIRCGDTLQDYIGPNRKDTLERKWQRFTEHQLPLASSEAARAALAPLFPGVQDIRSRVLLKGWLFHPLQGGIVDVRSSMPISDQHHSGWWCEAHQLELPQQRRSSRYAVLPKSRWLASCLLPADYSEVYSKTEAERLFRAHSDGQQQALMVVEVKRDLAGNWTEIDRGFILPRGWSNSTLELR